MARPPGGGHSWLVGESPFGLRDSGVHASPSFGQLVKLLVLELQLGQGWTKVLQKPLGQSASVMQPLPLFAPPTQAPVSQVPLTPQSASEQQVAPLPVHRAVSLVQVPPPAHAPRFPHALPQGAPGLAPPTHRFPSRSPLSQSLRLGGRLMV